jgi:hypothetical protein
MLSSLNYVDKHVSQGHSIAIMYICISMFTEFYDIVFRIPGLRQSLALAVPAMPVRLGP